MVEDQAIDPTWMIPSEQSERSSTRSLPLDLKFGGLNSELEVCSIQSLEAALRGVDAVDLKFGIAFEVGGSKFGEVCRSASKSALFKPGSSLRGRRREV